VSGHTNSKHLITKFVVSQMQNDNKAEVWFKKFLFLVAGLANTMSHVFNRDFYTDIRDFIINNLTVNINNKTTFDVGWVFFKRV